MTGSFREPYIPESEDSKLKELSLKFGKKREIFNATHLVMCSCVQVGASHSDLYIPLSKMCLAMKYILPSLHNRTHSKVEAWARWSARPKICLIVTISLQQSG